MLAPDSTYQSSSSYSKPGALPVPELAMNRQVRTAEAGNMGLGWFPSISSSLNRHAGQHCLLLATAAESSRMRVDLYLSGVGQTLNLFVANFNLLECQVSLVLNHIQYFYQDLWYPPPAKSLHLWVSLSGFFCFLSRCLSLLSPSCHFCPLLPCHPLAEKGWDGHSCAPSSNHSNTSPSLPAPVSIWPSCAHSFQLQLLPQVGTACAHMCSSGPPWVSECVSCQLQLQLWTAIEHTFKIWVLKFLHSKCFLIVLRPFFFSFFVKIDFKYLDMYFSRWENKRLEFSFIQPPSVTKVLSLCLWSQSIYVCCFGTSLVLCLYLFTLTSQCETYRSQFCLHAKASVHCGLPLTMQKLHSMTRYHFFNEDL